MNGGAVGADQIHPLGAQRGDPQTHLGEHVGIGPTRLGQHQIPLVVVAEQVGRAVDEAGDLRPAQTGQLLRGICGERQPQRPAFIGMGKHGVRIIGSDDHQIGLAGPGNHVGQLDISSLGHGSGIERGDLRHIQISGADEPCGVLGVGDQHVITVDAGSFQPLAVVGEVDAGRSDEQRVAAENADGVGHVSGHAAPMDDEVVHQKTERHLLQMFGQQLLGELPGEPHQVVSGNGSGHRDGHGASLHRLS